MHAGDAWITVGGDAWPEWPDTQRPDMPQQHDTATVQVPSDVHDALELRATAGGAVRAADARCGAVRTRGTGRADALGIRHYGKPVVP
jgi:hypothetical protein